MIFNRYHVAIHLLVVGWLEVCAVAQRNVTIDDQNPAIVYAPAGAWVLSANSSLDVGGAHMLTQNPNATATFQFTGVAIYYLSPKWPYGVNTAVSLDNGPLILIDLVDHSRPDTGQGPETVQSAVLWNATALNNTSHTLVVLVGPGQPFGVVDALIYTTLSPDNSPSTSALPPSSSSPQSSPVVTPPLFAPATSSIAATSGKKASTIHIALGALFGFIALIALVFTIIYYCKRRNRPKSEAWTVDDPDNGNGNGGTNYSYSASATHGMRRNGPSTAGNGGPWGTAQGAFLSANGRQPSGPSFPPPMAPQFGYVGAPPAPQAPAYNAAADMMYNTNAGGYMHDPPAQTAGYAVDAGRAPNRYQPGYTLSTITEKSTPRMGETRVELGPHSPASGQTDLGYYTAGSSEGGGAVPGTLQQQQQQQRHPQYQHQQPRHEKSQTTPPPPKGSAYWI